MAGRGLLLAWYRIIGAGRNGYGMRTGMAIVRAPQVLMAATLDSLRASQAAGGPLAGVMFWNAAHNNSADVDGCARR